MMSDRFPEKSQKKTIKTRFGRILNNCYKVCDTVKKNNSKGSICKKTNTIIFLKPIKTPLNYLSVLMYLSMALKLHYHQP